MNVETQRKNIVHRILDIDNSQLLTKIEELNSLANQGKTSLKTLWFIGGLAASILAFLATWSDVFSKG